MKVEAPDGWVSTLRDIPCGEFTYRALYMVYNLQTLLRHERFEISRETAEPRSSCSYENNLKVVHLKDIVVSSRY